MTPERTEFPINVPEKLAIPVAREQATATLTTADTAPTWDESLGAAYVTLAELDRYPLRGEEVRAIFRYVAAGGPV